MQVAYSAYRSLSSGSMQEQVVLDLNPPKVGSGHENETTNTYSEKVLAQRLQDRDHIQHS